MGTRSKLRRVKAGLAIDVCRRLLQSSRSRPDVREEILATLLLDLASIVDLPVAQKLGLCRPDQSEDEAIFFYQLLSDFFKAHRAEAKDIQSVLQYLLGHFYAPCIYALLLFKHLFKSGHSPAVSEMNVFLRGLNRLFWIDVENNQRAFETLYLHVQHEILEHLDEYPDISWDGRRDLMSLVCKFYFQYESSDRILKFLGKQQSALDRCLEMEDESLMGKGRGADGQQEGIDEIVRDEHDEDDFVNLVAGDQHEREEEKGKLRFSVPSLDISSVSIMSSRRPQTPPLSPRSPTWGSRVNEMRIIPLLELDLESDSPQPESDRGDAAEDGDDDAADDDDGSSDGKPHEELWRSIFQEHEDVIEKQGSQWKDDDENPLEESNELDGFDGAFESEAEDPISSAFHSEMDSDEDFFSDYGIESDHYDTGEFRRHTFNETDEMIPEKFLVGECFVRENVRILFHMRSKAALLLYLRSFAGMRKIRMSKEARGAMKNALYTFSTPGHVEHSSDREVRRTARHSMDILFPDGKMLRFLINISFRFFRSFSWPGSIVAWVGSTAGGCLDSLRWIGRTLLWQDHHIE
eukprot:TRINITY_DN649_c0_g1_i1.p2 TRINITY_DN649_c0_g1~~TRINITY_DN649_c0_g1_i1.p2  ORF type:complete len:578 (-),score=167.51 TRINITY_DN649_c0_g1_i1:2550-4283(-)